MENRQQQILDEIRSMIVSLRRQIEELESKMAELQPMEDVTEMEVSLDIMDMGIASEPEMHVVDDEVSVQEPELGTEPTQELAPESELELENVPEADDLPADDDLPFFDAPTDAPTDAPVWEPADESVEEDEDESTAVVAPEEQLLSASVHEEQSAPLAVIDAMIEKQAWRTDMPGTPVRDIRSAISLNDRILFINYLFNEDPMSFQETLTALNSMTSFDEAVNFVVAKHPEWDLESDTVYRFMMALRRRLQ